MSHTLNRQFEIKRYARIILALFVVSILNMAVQIPAHAAMLQSMQLQQMPAMPNMSEADCECPPVICESVDSVSEQGVEKVSSINFKQLLGFQAIYFSFVKDAHQQPSVLQLTRHDWQYRQISPPPISISSILHI